LHPAELEAVWHPLESSACYRAAAGTDKAWLDLWAAIARRDSPSIAALGTQLLAPQAGVARGRLAYLAAITAAADVRMGDDARAQTLLQAEWGRFDHTGPFDLALRELRAMTRDARP
jgi:hypothetical protein